MEWDSDRIKLKRGICYTGPLGQVKCQQSWSNQATNSIDSDAGMRSSGTGGSLGFSASESSTTGGSSLVRDVEG